MGQQGVAAESSARRLLIAQGARAPVLCFPPPHFFLLCPLSFTIHRGRGVHFLPLAKGLESITSIQDFLPDFVKACSIFCPPERCGPFRGQRTVFRGWWLLENFWFPIFCGRHVCTFCLLLKLRLKGEIFVFY